MVAPFGGGDVTASSSSVRVPPAVGSVGSVGSWVLEGGSDPGSRGGCVVWWWWGRVGLLPSSVGLDLDGGGVVVSSVESLSVAGLLLVVGSYAREGGSDSVC